jgi:hypothetical protein
MSEEDKKIAEKIYSQIKNRIGLAVSPEDKFCQSMTVDELFKMFEKYHQVKLKEQANNGFSDNDIKAIDSLYENDSTIKISDADIEAWAEKNTFYSIYATDLLIEGAKSMRDGLIKKIEK